MITGRPAPGPAQSRRRPFRSRTAAVLLVAAVAVLPGCSDDAGRDPAPTTATTSASPTPVLTGEAAEVQKAFATYSRAAITGDAATVAATVTAGTVDYYDRLRQLALTADQPTLQKERLIDQTTVLIMRREYDPTLLRTGEAGEVLAETMRRRLLPAGAEDGSTGGVTVKGDKAEVRINPEDPATLQLVREGGAWKVDVPTSQDSYEQTLAEQLPAVRGDRTRLVEATVLGAGPADDTSSAAPLWQPLGR